jgi:hypothetical protein
MNISEVPPSVLRISPSPIPSLLRSLAPFYNPLSVRTSTGLHFFTFPPPRSLGALRFILTSSISFVPRSLGLSVLDLGLGILTSELDSPSESLASLNSFGILGLSLLGFIGSYPLYFRHPAVPSDELPVC